MNLRKTRLANVTRNLLRKVQSLRVCDVRHLNEVVEPLHLGRLLARYRIDCVFDIGANSGQYARMLRERAGYAGLIVSFEPIPEMVSRIRQASARDKNWLIEELAVSDRNGVANFNVMRGSQFSSLSDPRHDESSTFTELNRVTRTIEVRTETLDAVFTRLKEKLRFSRPFLKMDTQGFDTAIVRGSETAIANFVGLQSELAVKKLYGSSVDFREAITLYQSRGFELSALIPNNSGQFPELIELDCIMLRGNLMKPAVTSAGNHGNDRALRSDQRAHEVTT